jgi:hypothetical protein
LLSEGRDEEGNKQIKPTTLKNLKFMDEGREYRIIKISISQKQILVIINLQMFQKLKKIVDL